MWIIKNQLKFELIKDQRMPTYLLWPLSYWVDWRCALLPSMSMQSVGSSTWTSLFQRLCLLGCWLSPFNQLGRNPTGRWMPGSQKQTDQKFYEGVLQWSSWLVQHNFSIKKYYCKFHARKLEATWSEVNLPTLLCWFANVSSEADMGVVTIVKKILILPKEI